MIDLRPMRADEFAAYRAYFVPDYAAEIEANFGLSTDEALVRANASIETELADGVETAGQVLLCLVAPALGDDIVVGYLWYAPDTVARSVFIFDFAILPAHRGKGFGKTALASFEADLAAQGYTEIRLRVAADNARAQHVYDRAGFRVTGINMGKNIG